MEDLDYNPTRKTRLRNNKWVSTSASILIQCTSGSLYTFPIYSSILKTSQSYSQSTLNYISFFKDFGANSGILSGLLSSATPSKPWIVILAGAVQCLFGYLMMWLSVTGTVPRPNVLVMSVYMFVAAHAMTFFNTANVVTGVCNFPSYSGTIVGIMKGFLGLSGAILIQVYQMFLKDDPTSYILLLALLPTVNSLLLMGFVRIFKTNEDDEKKHLNVFSFLAVVLAAYLTAVVIIQHILELRFSVRVFTFVVLIFLLVSPIFVAIEAQRHKSYRMLKSLLEHNEFADDGDVLDDNNIHISPDQGEYHVVPNTDDNAGEINDEQGRGDLNLLQAMRSINFWFLFFTTACAMGSGLATVNNLSQIGESLGYTGLEINTLVSLWSIWNFLGRFGAGYISDHFLISKGCPRPLFIVITLAAMTIGHAMIASGFPGALYAGPILVGICYGSQWSLMPTIASEIFGKVHMGTIFNTITIAEPIGSYILSVWVVGFIYDKEASEYGKTCIGSQCFMLAFIIMGCVTFSGFLVAMVLWFRTREFYKNVVIRRVLYAIKRSRVTFNTY